MMINKTIKSYIYIKPTTVEKKSSNELLINRISSGLSSSIFFELKTVKVDLWRIKEEYSDIKPLYCSEKSCYCKGLFS